MAEPLKDVIASLHAEIRRIEATHPEDKERLATLIAALERAEHPDTSRTHLTTQVREAVLHLEARHPKVTTLLNGVLESLGNVGI